MMNPRVLRSEKLSAPDAMRLEHDEMRAQLVSASMEAGPIGDAARRVARLCVPHFEQEEKLVFPIFELLHSLALGDVQREAAAVLPLVSRFCARHDRLHRHHKSIVSAIGALLAAAHKEHNREIATFAQRLWLHERTEDAVIYPMATLAGNYVREALGLRPRWQEDRKTRRSCNIAASGHMVN